MPRPKKVTEYPVAGETQRLTLKEFAQLSPGMRKQYALEMFNTAAPKQKKVWAQRYREAALDIKQTNKKVSE